MMHLRQIVMMAVGAGAAWASSSASAVTFNIPSTGNAQADAGFAAAAQLWQDRLADNITVNVTAGFSSLGAGVIGAASSTQGVYNYGNSVRPRLVADATSSDDFSSSGLLQLANVDLLLNRTSNNPNGSGSATPYLDDDGDFNNTLIRMPFANAKALGLRAAHDTASDSSITFNSDFAFDFDRSDGITPGQYDFIGAAAHEIGHALGFLSGVDILDINSPPLAGPFGDSAFTRVSTLDLFRFSAESVALGAGIVDWTADTRDKYFSVDGGATPVVAFSTGVNFGDGQQAGHWKDALGLGIMDPTLGAGELGVITATDLRAFDVIGYQIVPEPAGLSVFAFASFAALSRRRRAARE